MLSLFLNPSPHTLSVTPSGWVGWGRRKDPGVQDPTACPPQGSGCLGPCPGVLTKGSQDWLPETAEQPGALALLGVTRYRGVPDVARYLEAGVKEATAKGQGPQSGPDPGGVAGLEAGV